MILGQYRLLLFTFVLQMSNVNVNAKGEEDARMEAAAASFLPIFIFVGLNRIMKGTKLKIKCHASDLRLTR